MVLERSANLYNSPWHKSLLPRCFIAFGTREDNSRIVSISSGGDYGQVIEELSDFSSYGTLYLVKNEEFSGLGRVLDEWFDLNLITKWREACDKDHGDRCGRSSFSQLAPDVLPHYLIDVKDMCLRKSSPGDRYVALSYVWGKSVALKTLISNVEEHQQPGIFQQPHIASQMPRTVYDAIQLVQLLPERYLWVDAICLVQDDAAPRTEELNKMATIYSNAQLTIIASNAPDANFGLPGFREFPNHTPRKLSQHVGAFSNNGPFIIRKEGDEGDFMNGGYETRGWTFQEDLFSARKLIFTENRMQWRCLCDKWSEDFHMNYDYRSEALPSLVGLPNRLGEHMLFVQPWPDFEGYNSLTYRYHQRLFTYPEDVYEAFTSITTRLSHAFPGGFNFGLPELFFDIAVMWIFGKEHSDIPRQRLIPFNPTKCMPSWSWMGWRERVYQPFDYFEVSANKFKNFKFTPSSTRLVSLVQWYTLAHTTGEKRKIDHCWNKYVDSRHLGVIEPPRDWTRHPQTKTERQYFTTPFLPGAGFGQPVPLRHEFEKLDDSREISHLIWCRAQRCWLFVDVASKDAISLRYERLLDNQGQSAGRLQGNPSNEAEGECGMRRCELVAISLQTGALWMSDHLLPHLFLPEKNEEYNVLWIEWVGGIAYRKGIGRVYKDVWDRQQLEWIDLTLG